MAKLEIDLLDTSTEVENHQTEATKPGILHDSAIVYDAPKAKNFCENESEHFDVEGDVVKKELKVEIGSVSGSQTLVCKRISAEHEVVNVDKTAKSIKIKFKNEEHQNKNEDYQFFFL